MDGLEFRELLSLIVVMMAFILMLMLVEPKSMDCPSVDRISQQEPT